LKRGPDNKVSHICTIETPLGTMTARAENTALSGLWFTGQKYYPVQTDNWVAAPDYPLFTALREWLSDYFGGIKSVSDIKLEVQGTTFQKTVWNRLLQIPFGQVVTYGEIAREIDIARGTCGLSAQAVGGAVGHNPISILIPCHRVVGADRKLTGYAGGLDKKRALLQLEGIELSIGYPFNPENCLRLIPVQKFTHTIIPVGRQIG
jgi:methylated-DNA-[protein]-cysteine S-methyltransferase